MREVFLPHLTADSYDDAWEGAMFMTERTGGSDLSTITTVARQDGERWLLNGSKFFCSNVDAAAIVTLARPEGAARRPQRNRALPRAQAPQRRLAQRHQNPAPQEQARHPRRAHGGSRFRRRRGSPALGWRESDRRTRNQPDDGDGQRLAPRRGLDGAGYHAPIISGGCDLRRASPRQEQTHPGPADGARDARGYARRARSRHGARVRRRRQRSRFRVCWCR